MPLWPEPTRRTGAACVPTAKDWARNDPVAVCVEPGRPATQLQSMLPNPEYQRIYYDLAVEWSRLTAFKNARLKTQPQPIILENSQMPKITTARTAGPRHPHRTSKKISFFGSIRPPYNLDQA
jgi:hypothetical protein